MRYWQSDVTSSDSVTVRLSVCSQKQSLSSEQIQALKPHMCEDFLFLLVVWWPSTEINHEMNTGESSRLESTRVFNLRSRCRVSLSSHFISCQVESERAFVSSSSLSVCEWSSGGCLAPSSCPSPHRPGDFLPHATFNGALRQFKKQLWIFNERRKGLMWVPRKSPLSKGNTHGYILISENYELWDSELQQRAQDLHVRV